MTNDRRKSPEEWEAEDHIDTLKTRLLTPPEPCAPGCQAHKAVEETQRDQLRCDMWVIRRVDLILKTLRNGHGKNSGTEVELRPGRIKLVNLSAKTIERLALYAGAVWGIGKMQGWW